MYVVFGKLVPANKLTQQQWKHRARFCDHIISTHLKCYM